MLRNEGQINIRQGLPFSCFGANVPLAVAPSLNEVLDGVRQTVDALADLREGVRADEGKRVGHVHQLCRCHSREARWGSRL